MEFSRRTPSEARRLLKGYYFITDCGLTRQGIDRDTMDALRAGVTVVQYRRKDGSSRLLLEEARELRSLTHGVCFLINDRLDIALASDADGVHLGQSDLPAAIARKLLGPDRIIGVTVRSVEEARLAEASGADYVGVGAIFATTTKRDAGPPAGLDLIRRIRQAVSLPIAAIGGITKENAPGVIAAGANMVCAISAVVSDPHPEDAARRFQELFVRS